MRWDEKMCIKSMRWDEDRVRVWEEVKMEYEYEKNMIRGENKVEYEKMRKIREECEKMRLEWKSMRRRC